MGEFKREKQASDDIRSMAQAADVACGLLIEIKSVLSLILVELKQIRSQGDR